MKVLSLFDWISCARVALDRAWIPVEKYYASEIDKYAIQIAQKNYPDTVQVWSVVGYNHDWKVDLLIWWSPCQDLSIAKKDRKWLEWEKSWLFWEYVRILKEVQPKYFILENVASMKKEDKEIITKTLWVEPIMINAALVSAQQRKRLFWTNIPWVELPEDREMYLLDIYEEEVEEKHYCILYKTEKEKRTCKINREALSKYKSSERYNNPNRVSQIWKWWQWDRIYSLMWKSVCLSANWWWRGAKTWLYNVSNWVRKLTPIECERLQWLPDDYTEKWVEIVKDLCNIKKNLLLNKSKWQSVVLNDVKNKLSGCECVLCIEEDLTNTDVQIYQKHKNNQKKNVIFVITRYENREQGECAQNTIKIWKDTETHYILKKLESITGTKYQKIDTTEIIVEGTDTWYLWKITCEGLWKSERLYTILTLIRQIIQKKIFTFVNQEASIRWYIDNLKVSHENLLGLELYVSKMGSIISTSNTQRYKCLWNAFNVDVVAHILSYIKTQCT